MIVFMRMRKILDEPNNLLFAAAALIFLQFVAAAACFYAEAVIYFSFTGWTTYFYMTYCLAACAAGAAYILKTGGGGNREKFAVKLWVSGLFLYAFGEILFYIKARYMAYTNFYSWFSDEILIFWDNQPLYRLNLCAAVIFIIYCALFISGDKKQYAAFAGANLLVFGLVMFFMPETGSEYLAVDVDSSVFEVILVSAIRESGILVYMLNMFVFALHGFYHKK